MASQWNGMRIAPEKAEVSRRHGDHMAIMIMENVICLPISVGSEGQGCQIADK